MYDEKRGVIRTKVMRTNNEHRTLLAQNATSTERTIFPHTHYKPLSQLDSRLASFVALMTRFACCTIIINPQTLVAKTIASQLPPSPTPNIRAAALGHAHTLLLTTSNRLLTFGSDSHGQCSPPPFLSNNSVSKSAIFTGPHTSACITADGIAHVWGCSKVRTIG